MRAPVRNESTTTDPRLRIIPPTPFEGVLIGSEEWDKSDPQIGLYRFSATSPERSMIYQNNSMGTVYGTLIYDNKLFTMNQFELFGTYFTEAIIFDLNTGNILVDEAQVNRNLSSTALAYEESTGKIYGCFINYNTNSNEFGVLNPNTLTRTTISTLPGYLYAMAFTPDGRLVGLNPRTGNLYNINKTNGQLTLIGQTGVTSKYTTSGTVCPKTGYMYFAVCDDEGSSLYRIDTNTAEAVKMFDYADGVEIMGMHIPMPPYPDMVPAAAKDLDIAFEGLNLSGKLNFTAPDETFDGTKGEGTLKYQLYCNDELIKENEAEWGSRIEVPYEIAEPAFCRFRLTFCNEAGTGPAFEKGIFIGESLKPATIETVTLEIEGTTQKISWTPVESMYYGGDFDASRLTYKVVRNADNETVATGLTTTEYTDEYAEPGSQILLTYSVVPVYSGTEGDPTVSEEVVYGHLTPPFKETFHKNNIPFVQTWTVVDADGDGVLNWTHDYSAGRIRTKASTTSRDIYATPRIYLEPDRIYTVKYGVSSYSSSKTAHVSCWLSDSLEPDSFNICLAAAEPVMTSAKTTFEYFTGEFSVETPGFYYIGLKNEGGTGSQNYVDNFEVQAPAMTAAPASPSDLTAVADAEGKNEVALSFTLPTVTAGNEALQGLSGYEVKRGTKRIVRVTEGVEPGMAVSMTDTPEKSGVTEYTVTAFNTAGHGISARTTVYVGINIPNVVENVTISEPQEGYVTLTWDAPVTDRDGYPMNKDNIRYNILTSTRERVAGNISDTTYTMQALDEGRQDFLYFYVQTVSDAGESEFIVASPMLAVGHPYEIPFEESFAEGAVKTPWATVNYTGSIPSAWVPVKEIPEFPSADDDGGFVMSHSDDAGGQVALQSPKLNLDCQHPTLIFQYFAIPESHNTIEPRIALQGGEFESLDTITVSETGILGWQKVIIPLDQYAGQTVRLELLANCVNNSQTHFDAISIKNCNPVDIALVSVNAPEKIVTWKGNIFGFLLENVGRSAVPTMHAELYLGEELKDELDIDGIEPGGTLYTGLVHRPTIHDSETLEYKVVIKVDGDGDESNNVSEVITLPLTLPDFPTVEKISHTMDEEGINLTWEMPAKSSQQYDGNPLELTGYRIYRNGEFLQETTENNLEEKAPAEGDRIEYKISALYNLGESVLSEPYTFTYSGTGSIAMQKVGVRTETGIIIIEGANGLRALLSDSAAHCISYNVNSDRFVIEAVPGVYMLTIGGETYKLLVK